MSKKEGPVSEKEPDENENRSVFDFLYYDSNRIGSFLGQFYDAGWLKGLTEKESVSKVHQRGYKLALGGGGSLLGTGGNATVGVERTPGEQGAEETQRVYDPLWTNARTFIDYLNNNNMLNSDISSAKIGNFVYFKGSMTFIDIAMVGPTWKKQSFQSMMAQGWAEQHATEPANRAERRRQGATAVRQTGLPNEIQVLVDLLDVMPHTAQVYFSDEEHVVWGTVREEALITRSGDLLLKHGLAIEGEWGMVGILDAKPNSDTETTAATRLEALGLESGEGHRLAASLMISIAPLARNFLGRPPTAFGVTPLLIFREVSG